MTATRRELRELVIPAVLVAAMSVVATLGFRGVFPDWSFIPAAVIGATGATGVMFLGRWLRLSVPESLLVSLLAFSVLGAIAAEGVPTPSAFSTFVDGLINGWAQVLSSSPPADLVAEYRVLPYTIAWLGAMVGGEILRAQRTPGLAAIGPTLALVLSLLITLEDRTVAIAQGAAVLVGALLLGSYQQRRRTEQAELFEDHTIHQPRPWTGLLPALGVIALVAVVAPVVGPNLPLASANERFDLRRYQVPPFDPLEQPSPLVQIKASLQEENAERVVFTVTSDERIDRFPMAVLDDYNNEYWSVADEEDDAQGEFRPVDSIFPIPASGTIESRDRVTATIEIVDFDQLADGDFDPVWMPLPGWPTALSSDDALDLRFNAETGTLALAPEGPSAGLVYEVTAAVPPAIADVNLRSATVTEREPLDLAVPQIVSFASDVLEGADVGWEQVEAIRTRLVDSGFYDSRTNSDTARAGHRLSRVAEFLADPERVVGFEEQYAATAALIARSEGLPARVVVGYLIAGDDASSRWDGSRLEVVGDDMSAWIEVNFDGIGWIPFDVTPPRDREPEDTSVGRSQREVAVPNPPPDPPPPVLPPELDRDTEIEEEEDEEDDADDEDASDGGLPIGTILVSTAAATPVLGMVGAGMAVVGLKRRRTRRRRHAGTPSRRIAGAWHEVVDRYQELGARPRPNATTTEFARGLQAADLVDDADGDLLLQLAHDADEAAYHPNPANDDRATAAWERSDQLVEQIGKRQGPFVRLKNRLDPRPLFRNDPLTGGEESDD